jgi:hypothetical protein
VTDPAGRQGLPVRRFHQLATAGRRAVVVEIDATHDPVALSVLQEGLHDQPAGATLIHGYDLVTTGLGAWIGDRRIRLRVWSALLHDDGAITADDPDEPTTDVLVIDFDPATDAEALDGMAETGRLLIAGPEMGPVPLVLDVDVDLVREVLAVAKG